MRPIYFGRTRNRHRQPWTATRVYTDGNLNPEYTHRAPQHTKGWHPKYERHDVYMQDQTPKGRHRRAPQHREGKYGHLSYTVVVAA